MSSSGTLPRQATGNNAQQIEGARDKTEVTAEKLKDGYRGIGRMSVMRVHVSIEKELVRLSLARVIAKPPVAKKMKHWMFLRIAHMHGSGKKMMSG